MGRGGWPGSCCCRKMFCTVLFRQCREEGAEVASSAAVEVRGMVASNRNEGRGKGSSPGGRVPVLATPCWRESTGSFKRDVSSQGMLRAG